MTARKPKPYLEAYTALLVDLVTNHPDVARQVADRLERLERRRESVTLTKPDALVEAYRFTVADIRRELNIRADIRRELNIREEDR